MLRTNTVFCCHRNEIIARLKEDFGYETRLPLTGPIGDCVPLVTAQRRSFSVEFITNQILFLLPPNLPMSPFAYSVNFDVVQTASCITVHGCIVQSLESAFVYVSKSSIQIARGKSSLGPIVLFYTDRFQSTVNSFSLVSLNVVFHSHQGIKSLHFEESFHAEIV